MYFISFFSHFPLPMYLFMEAQRSDFHKGTDRQEKVEEDVQWDGWKGYITNTDMSAKEVVSQYHELWGRGEALPYNEREP